MHTYDTDLLTPLTLPIPSFFCQFKINGWLFLRTADDEDDVISLCIYESKKSHIRMHGKEEFDIINDCFEHKVDSSLVE